MMQLLGFMTTIVSAAFIAGILTIGAVEATQFNFSFSGNGTTGNIVFDDSIVDTNSDPLKGQYLGAIVQFNININGTPQTETGIPTFESLQGSSGSVIVGLAADGIGACGLTVNCLAFLLGSNTLSFYYPAGSLSSDALPITVPATGEAILGNDLRQFFLGSDAFASITSILDTIPPAITVSASPATLWPPNGKMVSVMVSGTITDSESGSSGVNASSAAYMVEDEYKRVQPSGPVTLEADGSYSFTIQLQASRNGTDKNGRQYIVTISVEDNAGNSGSAATGVTVPHDQGH